MKTSLLHTPTLIAAKRDGGALADGEIRALIDGAVSGDVPDYQLSALLMAILWRGLTTRELATWTRAMIDSGDRLRWDDLPGPVVDKHSTGGVGDKVSLCLAPLCAAAGLYVPMMAGRALGHTGGTLDKLETIPGFRTALEPREFGAGAGARRLRAGRPERAPGPRRPAPLCAARRHRHRRIDPAHRVVDPVQEGRRGNGRAGDGRQGRQRRVLAVAGARRASWRGR